MYTRTILSACAFHRAVQYIHIHKPSNSLFLHMTVYTVISMLYGEWREEVLCCVWVVVQSVAEMAGPYLPSSIPRQMVGVWVFFPG